MFFVDHMADIPKFIEFISLKLNTAFLKRLGPDALGELPDFFYRGKDQAVGEKKQNGDDRTGQAGHGEKKQEVVLFNGLLDLFNGNKHADAAAYPACFLLHVLVAVQAALQYVKGAAYR